MTATEAQVAAAMEALGCRKSTGWQGQAQCGHPYHPPQWTDRGYPVAAAVADAVVAAGPDPAKVAADTLREAAQGYYAARHEIGSPSYLQAEDWLLRRADRIEPKP